MWMWLAAAAYGLGVLAFLPVWTAGRKPSPIMLLAALLSGTAAAFIPVSGEAVRFFIALVLAGAGWLIAGAFLFRTHLLSSAAVYAAFIAPWAAFLKCSDCKWEYALCAAGLLLCLLFALAEHVLHRELAPISEQHTAKRFEALLLLLPLVSIPAAAAVTVFLTDGSYVKSAMGFGVILTVSALSLVLQDQVRQRIKAQLLNRAFTQWQQESRDYMNTIRSQRHDFNLHLNAITGLTAGGEYAELQKYVNKLVSEAAAVNDIMPVADAVIGSMLYNMREKARSKGSDIVYDIKYDLEDVACTGFECNKIIGNLLQNAIDALETPEDMANGIRCGIFKRRGAAVITVENRFTGDKAAIAKAFEPGYSTKRKHDGIGLAMVRRTVERYSGRVYPEFEDEVIRFVVNIPNTVSDRSKAK